MKILFPKLKTLLDRDTIISGDLRRTDRRTQDMVEGAIITITARLDPETTDQKYTEIRSNGVIVLRFNKFLFVGN